MYSIFWIAFGICFLINLVRNGDGYILFYRYVTYMNQLKEPKVNLAREDDEKLLAEYYYGRRIYGININKLPPVSWNEWVHVAIFKISPVSDLNGKVIPGSEEIVGPLVKTGKIEYFAGPYKNFHNKRDTPKDLNRKYTRLAFMYADNSVIHVNQNEIIVDKLIQVRSKYDKQE